MLATMPTRQRRPAPPPTPTPERLVFVLATVGDATTDEHRLTGALLERHWARLSPEALRAIALLIRGAMDGAT
jgi:hypothetical protein